MMAGRSFRHSVTAAVFALACINHAEADDNAAKYGIPSEIPPGEVEADKQFGGYPNNKDFNNDTPCMAVIELFDEPQLDHDPRLWSFVSYSRVKLMEFDIGWPTFHGGQNSLIDVIGLKQWQMLPAAIPSACRAHPGEDLDHAAIQVYQAARELVQRD